MKNDRRKRGFTLLETLAVVALIAVVAVGAVTGAVRGRRSLRLLEMDSVAKEIFVAAQNHLVMAESQGYPGCTDFGTCEGGDIYYLVVDGGTANGGSVLEQMLPFGAIDETVRTGGSYIIRYQVRPAQVMDVFYAKKSGEELGHSFSADEYGSLMAYFRGDENKEARSRYGADHAVIGYYGGAAASQIPVGKAMKPPAVRIVNEARLSVTVSDPNESGSLKLIVTGVASGVSREMEVDRTLRGADSVYTVVLDDITVSGKHFFDLFCKDDFGGNLIPGEDISIQAVAYSDSELTNVAYSAKVVVNSLFASRSGSTVTVSNIRHLQNLSGAVSGVDGTVTAAVQKGDLSRTVFLNGIGDDNACVYRLDGTSSPVGTILPVEPVSGFCYDGGGFRISEIQVSAAGNAGLFGTLNGGSISDMELVDCSVSGKNAGALAGAVYGTAVSGVLARNSRGGSAEPEITGTDSAGGLIGRMSGGSVKECAAALYVSAHGGDAGGLIGSAEQAEVERSYSGGHTVGGMYLIYAEDGQEGRLNVRGANAGGLIGSMSDTAVDSCYSTCSASGSGTAGGLIGAATAGSISNCYAVGYVGESTASGGLLGSANGTAADGSRYLEIANPGMPPVGSGSTDGISAMDTDKSTYSSFIHTDSAACTYDSQVAGEFGGKYYFSTVAQLAGVSDVPDFLACHYGDWSVPETLIVNDSAFRGGVSELSARAKADKVLVIYALNGGDWTETDGIEHNWEEYWDYIEVGGTVTKPNDPKPPKDRILLGWTTNPYVALIHDFTKGPITLAELRSEYLWDFDDPVTSDMILHAVWSETVTVTFSLSSSLTTGRDIQRWARDNDGSYYVGKGGSGITTKIAKGDTVKMPIDPGPYTKKQRYDFYRWLDGNSRYSKKAFDSLEEIPQDLIDSIFDFSTPVLEDKILYPSWGVKGAFPDPEPDEGGEVKVILKKISTVYEVLPGAEFTLTRENGGVVEAGLTSDANGIIFVGTLTEGTYYLQETAAPYGYGCPEEPFVLVVTADGVLVTEPEE